MEILTDVSFWDELLSTIPQSKSNSNKIEEKQSKWIVFSQLRLTEDSKEYCFEILREIQAAASPESTVVCLSDFFGRRIFLNRENDFKLFSEVLKFFTAEWKTKMIFLVGNNDTISSNSASTYLSFLESCSQHFRVVSCSQVIDNALFLPPQRPEILLGNIEAFQKGNRIECLFFNSPMIGVVHTGAYKSTDGVDPSLLPATTININGHYPVYQEVENAIVVGSTCQSSFEECSSKVFFMVSKNPGKVNLKAGPHYYNFEYAEFMATNIKQFKKFDKIRIWLKLGEENGIQKRKEQLVQLGVEVITKVTGQKRKREDEESPMEENDLENEEMDVASTPEVLRQNDRLVVLLRELLQDSEVDQSIQESCLNMMPKRIPGSQKKVIRIQTVTMKDFKIFTDCTWNLPEVSKKQIFKVAGDNGVGKSSLSLALFWALTGQTGACVSSEEMGFLAHHGSKEGIVIVKGTVNDTQFEIERRTSKPACVTATIGDQKLASQTDLNDHLFGKTTTVGGALLLSCFINELSVHDWFVRFNSIGNDTSTIRFPEIELLMLEEIKVWDGVLTKVKLKQDELRTKLKTNEETQKELKKNWNKACKDKETWERQLKDLPRSKYSLPKKEEIKQQYQTMTTELTTHSQDVETAEANVTNHSQTVQRWEDLEKYKKNHQAMQKCEASCPSCQNGKSDLQRKNENIQKKQKFSEGELAMSLESVGKKQAQTQTALREAERQLQNLKLHAIVDIAKKHKEVEIEITNEKKKTEYENKVKQQVQNIQSFERKITTEKDIENDLKARLKDWSTVEKRLGDTNGGIRLRKHIYSLLSDQVTKLVSQIDENWRFSIQPSAIIQATVNVLPQPWDSCSAGEKTICTFCFALAYRQLLQEQAGIFLDIMFLDEVFGTLDGGKRNKTPKLLCDTLNGSTGFVVSHDADWTVEYPVVQISKDANSVCHIKNPA